MQVLKVTLHSGQEYARRLPEQSIQLYHLALEGGRCELSKPDARLDDCIDYYWLLTITEPQLDLEVIPDTAIDLVLSPDIEAFAALYFPVNTKFHIPLSGPVSYAGTCFKSANAATILGHDLQRVRELNVGVDTLKALNIEQLASEVLGLKTLEACTAMFDSFWLNRLNATGPALNSHCITNRHNILTLLQQAVGNSNLSAVCKTLQISERQFRRLSGNLFGLRARAKITSHFQAPIHPAQLRYSALK